MIKSFSGQIVFCFAIPEPYLLTLAKTDYPSISLYSGSSDTGPYMWTLPIISVLIRMLFGCRY